MLPALVLPIHDPSGVLLAQLGTITPVLRQHFAGVFLSISPRTEQHQAHPLRSFRADPFFAINENAAESLPGDHYLAGYRSALAHADAAPVIHLCDLDKLTAILDSYHRAAFLRDIEATSERTQPLLFQRSAHAWASYPRPYREIEQIAIALGQHLFARYLDFAWSYLVVPATTLERILPRLHQRTFGLLAEMVLLLQGDLQTQDVDWLFWEDPFIEGRDPDELRRERETSREETMKRLRANTPIIRLLLDQIERS